MLESQFATGEGDPTTPILSILGEQNTPVLGASSKKHWSDFSLDFYKQKYSLSGENVVDSIDEGVGKLNRQSFSQKFCKSNEFCDIIK